MDTTRTTRRGALVGVASGAILAAWPTLGRAATGPVTLDEFMELSEALTDNEFSLRDQVGKQYLAALDPAAILKLIQATERSANPPKTFNQILASGALNDQGNAETAQQILVYWYSGLVQNRTADYLEALAWETLGFAAVSSTPLGFPDWDEAPS